MEDVIYRVKPHVLRRITGTREEEVATAHVDGREVLIVPVTEEAAEKCSRMPAYDGLEALPVTVGEIEEVCKNHGLVLVGFVGFESDFSLSVVQADTVGLILFLPSPAAAIRCTITGLVRFRKGRKASRLEPPFYAAAFLLAASFLARFSHLFHTTAGRLSLLFTDFA